MHHGIGLVGNLAKTQSADLLCIWQAWERDPPPPHPTDTELPCRDFIQRVCGHVDEKQRKTPAMWTLLGCVFVSAYKARPCVISMRMPSVSLCGRGSLERHRK